MYGRLLAEVREAGLLRRRHGYYAAVITANLAVFAGAWVGFAFLGDTWWQRLAFVGHEQIFRTRRSNDAVGVVHGGLVGMSYPWWIHGHNRHHANPNHEEHDLDIPAPAFTGRQARAKQGFLRWMAKNQAFLFFPLLALEGLR